MFNTAVAFNQPIGNWNVSNVTNMSSMFYYAQNFNQDISGWDVGNVTNMGDMFSRAFNFNQDITNWSMGNVTNIGSMLNFAGVSSQNLGNWDISSVRTTDSFVSSSFQFSTSDYDAILIGWEATLQLSYPSGSGYFQFPPSITFGSSVHTTGGAAEAAKNSLISTFNWTITDGNP